MSFFHPRFRSLLSSALVLGTLALGPVSAQTFDLDFNMLMMQSTFQGINQYNQMDTIIHDTQARDARNGIYYPANEHLRGTQAPSRPAINTTITYQTAISDEAKRQHISRIRKAHGDRIADAFLAEFTRQNVRSAFREQTRAYGLRDDRYEDVFSAYILTMWMIANKTNPPSADQVQAVARQALDIFNTSGLPQDPRERQLAAEMMM